MRYVLMSALLVAWWPTPSDSKVPKNSCDYGWFRKGSKCYHYMGPESSYTFEEARYECRKHFGAQLVAIKNEGEQQFVETMFKDVLTYNNVWLGARWARGQPSGFLWEDRSVVRYNNRLIAPDPKKNKTTLCLSMVVIPEYYGIWSAYDCNYYFSVLCEKPAESSAVSVATFEGLAINLALTLTLFAAISLPAH